MIVNDASLLDLALSGADVAPMLMAMVHLSGEEHWLDEVAPYITGPWNFHENAPDALKQRMRARLKEILLDYAATGRELPAEPPPHLLHKMLSAGVGGPVPEEYMPMIREEMMLDNRDPKTVHWRTEPRGIDAFKAVIVGSGVSGLCMAIKMREAGIPFIIYEKNHTVGGTWLENGYPGCGVDTPNHFYSLSFEPNHDWTEHFSKRNELWSYMEKIADKYDIRRHIRFNTEVLSAIYDETASLWDVTVRNSDGEVETNRANAFISAVGQLNRPLVPEIEGIRDFAGPVFHTARCSTPPTRKWSGRTEALAIGTRTRTDGSLPTPRSA